MEAKDLARSLLRRWYVLLVGLLLTAAAVVGVARTMPVTYDASSSVLLLPPDSSVGEEGNPYLYLGGLGQAVDVLVMRLNSDTVAQPILDRHPDVTLTVSRDVTTTGPIILVTSSAPDPADGEAAVDEVVAALPAQLADLQSALGVPDGSVITSTPLTEVEDAAPNGKARLRAAIAVLGAGLVLSLLVTSLVDRQLVERRRRRAERLAAPATGPVDEGPVDDGPVDEAPVDEAPVDAPAAAEADVPGTAPSTAPGKALVKAPVKAPVGPRAGRTPVTGRPAAQRPAVKRSRPAHPTDEDSRELSGSR